MCGIAGVFAYRSSCRLPDEAVGRAMVNCLVHRGPDAGGVLVTEEILLGHRRLSILDLSDDGRQPMSDDQGECWISYNGEVYNFVELRQELESLGHRFRSKTDTEVILKGYRQWGREVITRLNGMFAFALWDRRNRSLWLARDHVGIKPLFVRDDGQRIWFASELKALLLDPEYVRRPDWRGLDAFLTFGYVPAPLTGFEGIGQLEPGESLIVQAEVSGSTASVRRERWFRLPYPDRPETWDANECSSRLDSALHAAVKRQMVSDVPLGALLSGGLDSSAVVRSMRHAGASQLETFTIGFTEPGFDESPYAEQVAKIFETTHHCGMVEADAVAHLQAVLEHAEDPFADNSMIPFHRLARFTRERVTVALSGDGADELLGGYDTYRASEAARWYRAIPRPLRTGLIAPLAHRLPVSHGKYGFTNVLRRFVDAAGDSPPRDHCGWRRMISAALRSRLYSDHFLKSADGDPIGLYAAAVQDAPDWLTPLGVNLHLDLRFHLPNDMLVKVDRMSMAHSLEVRVPFLDLEVIRVCLAMNPDRKRSGKRGKLPLRAMLAKDLPSEITERKKGGFLSPLERWLAGPWQPVLKQVLTREFAEETGAFLFKELQRLVAEQASGRGDHAYSLFTLLMLGLWWRRWMQGEVGSLGAPSGLGCQPATTKVAQPTQIIRLKNVG